MQSYSDNGSQNRTGSTCCLLMVFPGQKPRELFEGTDKMALSGLELAEVLTRRAAEIAVKERNCLK